MKNTKNIIAKSITVISMFAIMLMMAMPMQAEAANTLKLNKTKITLDMSKTKTYKLKIKGTKKKVKWTTSNKKVATVSKKGKVTAKKKGTAVVKAKVGKKTLTCKVTVKDNRNNTGDTGNGGGNDNGNTKTPTDTNTDTCNHAWAKDETNKVYVTTFITCSCGKRLDTNDDYVYHEFINSLKGDDNHSAGPVDIYKVVSDYCIECGATRKHECQHGNWVDVHGYRNEVDTIVKKICTECGLEKPVQ